MARSIHLVSEVAQVVQYKFDVTWSVREGNVLISQKFAWTRTSVALVGY